MTSNGVQIPKDFNSCLYEPIETADPEIAELIKKETYRQFRGLELIASENLTSLAVMQANGSFLTNKYSEGLPGNRYYGGNEYIDIIEEICQKRALECFHLNPEEWGVNVQPYSGSTANFAAFTALVPPHSRIMGLALPDGGHLTHGAFTPKRKISSSSIYFESMPYQVDPATGLIDYPLLKKNANLFKPKVIICGASAYPRDWDYKTLRGIADEQEAYLMSDMAHISGLVAAQVQNNPFEYCDIVCTTTHKTLRGPRAGLIFFNKKRNPDMEKRVNEAVFPACQGGPHNNTIAAVAIALKQASQPEFKEYATQIINNTRTLGEVLNSHGYKLCTSGSDNHLLLWDLRPLGLTGSKIEKVLDLVHITLNKNSVPGDKSAQTPGGVRIGTNALTSRSMKEPEMKIVGDFLKEAVDISLILQKESGSKLLKDFLKVATSGETEGRKKLKELQEKVQVFATQFPLPGVRDTETLKP